MIALCELFSSLMLLLCFAMIEGKPCKARPPRCTYSECPPLPSYHYNFQSFWFPPHVSSVLLTLSSLCSLHCSHVFRDTKAGSWLQVFVGWVFLQAPPEDLYPFSEKLWRNRVKSSWFHHAKQEHSKVKIPLFICKKTLSCFMQIYSQPLLCTFSYHFARYTTRQAT